MAESGGKHSSATTLPRERRGTSRVKGTSRMHFQYTWPLESGREVDNVTSFKVAFNRRQFRHTGVNQTHDCHSPHSPRGAPVVALIVLSISIHG